MLCHFRLLFLRASEANRNGKEFEARLMLPYLYLKIQFVSIGMVQWVARFVVAL